MIGKVIQIRLTDEQVQLLSTKIGESAAAHCAEDCIFPGYSLRIDVGGGWGNSAVLLLGMHEIDLGDVDLQWPSGRFQSRTDL